MTLTACFEQLHENLKLDPGELESARDLHQRLSEYLIDCGIAKRIRLQGSLARGTMLPPLKDIDKIIELTDELGAELDEPGGPAKAMSLIAAALESFEKTCTFEFGKHAVDITIDGYAFHFDAVPAINEEIAA